MRRISLFLCFFFLLSSAALAQNYTLNLQGKLTDSQSHLLPDDKYTVQFRLYDQATNGTLKWHETDTVTVYTKKPVVNDSSTWHPSSYNQILGQQSNNPLPASLFSQTMWLEIWLNNQPPPSGTARKQVLQIQADSTIGTSINQIIYVTNALYQIENKDALEDAALAYYVLQVYKQNPNADPNLVIRSLILAEGTFAARYKSPVDGKFRFPMLPYDIISNMYGILAQQPGNTVAPQMINESLNFIEESPSSQTANYTQSGFEAGRLRVSGGFNAYQNLMLQQLYLKARTNPLAGLVVDIFFGVPFNALVSDSSFTILNKNPDLSNSMNFAPLKPLIEPDGTMLTLTDTTLSTIEDFYDRMSEATAIMAKALGDITNLERSDYVGAVRDPNTVMAIQNTFNTAFSQASPMLQAAGPVQIIILRRLAEDPLYKEYEVTSAGLKLAKSIASAAADAAEASEKIGLDAGADAKGVADGLEVAGAVLDLAATAITSPTDTIIGGINQIGGQLQEIQTQINSRLDIIDANIATLYNTMNTDFQNLKIALTISLGTLANSINTLTSDVLNLQYTLDRLTQDFSNFATQNARSTNLVPYLITVDNWEANPVPLKPDANGFQMAFDFCQAYATNTCLTPLENGNLGGDGFNSDYTDVKILNQLDTNQEKNLNYLMAFAYHRFYLREQAGDVEFTKPIAPPLHSVNYLANPTSWEMSAIGIMRAASLYPDLGDPYIYQTNSGFVTAYNIGQNLQAASTSVTLQQMTSNGNTTILKSPILADMLLHQQQMAAKLYNDIVADEANASTQSLADRVAQIDHDLNTPSHFLYNDAQALEGSRRLLEQFIEFGLSRSAKNNYILSSLLYAQGATASNSHDYIAGTDPNDATKNYTFRDPVGNIASDPNAQRLPDGTWVKSLYHNWVVSQPANKPYIYVTADPKTLFMTAQSERWGALNQMINGGIPNGQNRYVNGILDVLASDANTNGVLLGEPLSTVDAVLDRLTYFLIPQVSGTITAVPVGTVDQQQALQAASGSVMAWQSFTAGSSSNLANIDIYAGTTGNVVSTTLKIYAGEGTSGALLATQTITVAPTLRFQSFPIFVPNLGKGQKYTWSVGPDSRLLFGYAAGNPYPGGMADLGPTYDYAFRTWQSNLTGNSQPPSLANRFVMMTFRGLQSTFMVPVTLDDNGSYAITVPKDTYTVVVKTAQFLAAPVQAPNLPLSLLDTNAGNIASVNAQLIIGDISGDNSIDNTDLILLRNAWLSQGKTPPFSSIWNPLADLNGDGLVNMEDLNILRANWGKRGY